MEFSNDKRLPMEELIVNQPKVVGLTCTNGRFSYLKRLLTCFLAQEYDNKELLIYNNAPVGIQLKPLRNVTLINNNIDQVTGTGYNDVGSIYRDALKHVPKDCAFISIMDDDDIFLPNHFSLGAEFLSKNFHYKVWRPGWHFLKSGMFDVELKKTIQNLEGSCIIDFAFLREVNFEINTSLKYNLKWLYEAMVRGVFYQENDKIEPSFCCEYGQTDIFHISSYSFNNPTATLREMEKFITKIADYGEGELLEPWSKTKLLDYLELYFNLENFDEIDI